MENNKKYSSDYKIKSPSKKVSSEQSFHNKENEAKFIECINIFKYKSWYRQVIINYESNQIIK